VTCDVEGEVKAYLDDLSTPVLSARDTTLGHGLVGLGSFDDTGLFDDIELRGVRRPVRSGGGPRGETWSGPGPGPASRD
jgi:hypothetical protein